MNKLPGAALPHDITITTIPPFLEVGLKHISLSTGRDNLSVRVLERRIKLSRFISRLNFKAAEEVAGSTASEWSWRLGRKLRLPPVSSTSWKMRHFRWEETRPLDPAGPGPNFTCARNIFSMWKMEGNLCDRSKNTPEDGRVINRQRDRLQTRGESGGKNPNETKKETLLPPPLTFLAD